MRTLKSTLKVLLRKTFEVGQSVGVDILPRHYYSEVPDLRRLRVEAAWRSPYAMLGVAGLSTKSQLDFIRLCMTPAIFDRLRAEDTHLAACAANGAPGYGRVEADFLFAFVATQKPREIFQIGCGVSTALCLAAASHARYTPAITCVEPYPSPYLQRLAQTGAIRLMPQRAQDLEPATIEALGPDTLFFVDSSHTLDPAGEVSRIILEMLPRLKHGATVHFHDILFPYDYDRHILKDSLFFQHESVLLHAFLAYNPRFSVQASFSFLHHQAAHELTTLLPRYQPAPNHEGLAAGEGDFPSSIYLSVEA